MAKADEPIQKHTLFLFEGDFRWLQESFPEPGASIMIRNLVRKFRQDVEKSADKKGKKVNLTGMKL